MWGEGSQIENGRFCVLLFISSSNTGKLIYNDRNLKNRMERDILLKRDTVELSRVMKIFSVVTGGGNTAIDICEKPSNGTVNICDTTEGKYNSNFKNSVQFSSSVVSSSLRVAPPPSIFGFKFSHCVLPALGR